MKPWGEWTPGGPGANAMGAIWGVIGIPLNCTVQQVCQGLASLLVVTSFCRDIHEERTSAFTPPKLCC